MAKKPFDLDLKHNPKRNGYDLSKPVYFSAKPSELLPIWHRSVLPTDNFKIRVQHKTRTKPLNTAAYVDIKEYFDFFFVPYSFLWKNAKQVHTENTKNSIAAINPYGNLSVGQEVPHFDINQVYNLDSIRDTSYPPSIFTKLNDKWDVFGMRRSYQMTKLLNYLGYPYVSITDLDILGAPNTGDEFPEGVFGKWVQSKQSLYPLLAYNAIYYTFFRNKVWETNQPYNYNVDYLSSNALVSYDTTGNQVFWNNPTLFDLKYSNYPKDLIFGLLPDSQEGEVSVAEGSILQKDGYPSRFVDVGLRDSGSTTTDLADMSVKEVLTSEDDYRFVMGVDRNSFEPVDGDKYSVRTSDIAERMKSQLSILELRKSSFVQRYREILGSGELDYQKIIYKLFGVEISNEQEGLPVYLGGDVSSITISEVVNQALGDGAQADIKGKGEINAKTSEIEFHNTNKEYGLIMCIYHAQPVVQYGVNSLHFDCAKVEADDYANPVFDQLGFEEFPLQFFTTDRNSVLQQNVGMLGYTTRYYDYKLDFGRIVGSLKASLERGNAEGWIAPITEKNMQLVRTEWQDNRAIDYNFFKMSPKVLDPIFSVKAGIDVTTDPFDCFANFEVHAVRPLDYHGFPY